jgi:hypothetical protein
MGGFGPLVSKCLSLLTVFFENFDAGGQSDLSRALLRLLLCVACLSWLLLPGRQVPEHSVPWGGFFLLGGLISVALSPRSCSAEVEWEAWLLYLLLGAALLWTDTRRWRAAFLSAFYLLLIVLLVHAFWVAVPTTGGRLGGVFHHSNALSTLCLMSLPLLVWRSSSGGKEAFIASLSGGLCGFTSRLVGLPYRRLPSLRNPGVLGGW